MVHFLRKLQKMVTDECDSTVIRWQNGAIVIVSPQALIDGVLNKYFRHSNYTSFQRQLNYFGFKKVAGGRNKNNMAVYVNAELEGRPVDALLACKKRSSRPSPLGAPAPRILLKRHASSAPDLLRPHGTKVLPRAASSDAAALVSRHGRRVMMTERGAERYRHEHAGGDDDDDDSSYRDGTEDGMEGDLDGADEDEVDDEDLADDDDDIPVKIRTQMETYAAATAHADAAHVAAGGHPGDMAPAPRGTSTIFGALRASTIDNLTGRGGGGGGGGEAAAGAAAAAAGAAAAAAMNSAAVHAATMEALKEEASRRRVTGFSASFMHRPSAGGGGDGSGRLPAGSRCYETEEMAATHGAASLFLPRRNRGGPASQQHQPYHHHHHHHHQQQQPLPSMSSMDLNLNIRTDGFYGSFYPGAGGGYPAPGAMTIGVGNMNGGGGGGRGLLSPRGLSIRAPRTPRTPGNHCTPRTPVVRRRDDELGAGWPVDMREADLATLHGPEVPCASDFLEDDPRRPIEPMGGMGMFSSFDKWAGHSFDGGAAFERSMERAASAAAAAAAVAAHHHAAATAAAAAAAVAASSSSKFVPRSKAGAPSHGATAAAQMPSAPVQCV